MCNSEIWGCFTLTLKTPIKLVGMDQNKMSNNSETVRDTRNVSMNHDYEIGVALSDSVNKTCVKRPLADKSRWRHNRFKIKPHFLANHASQMNSYYGMLAGIHDHSFRIRYEKSPEAPPGGEITVTSYPACNKTSLSRKPCITHKMYTLRITIRKSCSLFQNPAWNSPSGGLTMTSYPVDNKTSLSRKSCITVKSYYWSLSWSFGRLVIFL